MMILVTPAFYLLLEALHTATTVPLSRAVEPYPAIIQEKCEYEDTETEHVEKIQCPLNLSYRLRLMGIRRYDGYFLAPADYG